MQRQWRWAGLGVAMVAAALLAAAQPAAGGPCSLTFTTDKGEGTFAGAFTFDRKKGEYVVDLSGLPKDAKIFRAELVLNGREQFGRIPAEPTKVTVVGQEDKPLKLIGPYFRSLDALAAVRAAVAAGEPLRIRAECTLRGLSHLEVSCEDGKVKAADIPVVANVRAVHRAGQTMITFTEPKLAEFPEFATGADVAAFRKKLLADHPGLAFRFWRSGEPITAKTIGKATLVGECGLMTAWNDSYNQGDTGKAAPVRYRVEDGGEPVAWGTGIFTTNPAKAGKAYYAVTVAVNGEEDFDTLSRSNTTAAPLAETVGLGVPILQWVEKPEKGFCYVNGPVERRIYTRWESWPDCSVPDRPIDYLVALPPTKVEPAPVGLHLHCWGGSLNGGYGWWYNGAKGAILIASNQVPYDWWTGYHEANDTNKTYGDGHVWPFTMNRLFSFLDWAKTQWKIDDTRVFTAGSSMGGSGAPMYAVRYGDRIAWAIAWVGVHVPAESPTFTNSYEGSYGPVKDANTMPDGTNAWDWFSDVWWLKKFPTKETGIIYAANGKSDGGIGWPQAVEFARALQETRRPHIYNWGPGGHGTRTLFGSQVPIDARTDQSLPAFTRCSLDDNIGTATRKSKEQLDAERAKQEAEKAEGKRREILVDPYDGDSSGQFNAWLRWDTTDIVDTPAAWEMTCYLEANAPRDDCVVDLTPRRLQKFSTPAGKSFTYTVTDLAGGKALVTKTAKSDELGLLTLPQIFVTKGKVRVKIVPAK